MDGRSFRPLLEGKPADDGEPEAVFIEYFGKQQWRVPIRMVRTRTFKYVRYLRYGEELYDLEHDPHELTNLANDSIHAARKQTLSDRLDHWMARTRDPFAGLAVTDRAGKPLPAQGRTQPAHP